MVASLPAAAPPVNARPPPADRTGRDGSRRGENRRDGHGLARWRRARWASPARRGAGRREGLTDAQLNEALGVQREDKGRRRRLGEVITALGLADEVAIARALSDQLGLPFLDLGNLPIPEETLAVLPRNVALRHNAIPVTLAHDVLTVALADPTNVLALDDIRLATKLGSVRTAVATASDLQEAVNRYYGGATSGGVNDSFGALADVEGLEATEDREEDLDQVGDVDDAPVVRLVNAIMGEALHSRASDIHVEPQERDVRVRYRIDGLLREVTVVPKALQGPRISRIKILSGMDISERRKPQDGRGRIKLERLEADTRVSSMPTMHGVTVVIRLLRKETEKAKTLAEVGLDERDRVVVEQALGEPQGLILITGPTGSGKTSSLYAGLASMIRPDINVVTLEDPVEYQMRGVNQVQINERVGLTFAGGLRTILRQDPDIVMVGEIRDPETASIAMQGVDDRAPGPVHPAHQRRPGGGQPADRHGGRAVPHHLVADPGGRPAAGPGALLEVLGAGRGRPQDPRAAGPRPRPGRRGRAALGPRLRVLRPDRLPGPARPTRGGQGDPQAARADRGPGDRGRPQGGGRGRRHAQHAGRRPGQGPGRPDHPRGGPASHPARPRPGPPGQPPRRRPVPTPGPGQ